MAAPPNTVTLISYDACSWHSAETAPMTDNARQGAAAFIPSFSHGVSASSKGVQRDPLFSDRAKSTPRLLVLRTICNQNLLSEI
eukprot:1602846-Rhodomonas_salina.1